MIKKVLATVVALAFIFSLAGVSLAIDSLTITKYQKNLKVLGLYKGEPTGKLDEATIEAIKECQKRCGMEPTGKLDKTTCHGIWKEVQKELAPTDKDFEGEAGK